MSAQAGTTLERTLDSGRLEPSTDIAWFEHVGVGDVGRVGGKNASLGEMVQALGSRGVRVPPGFATTSEAFGSYIDANDMASGIREHLERFHGGRSSLAEAGAAIRQLFLGGEFPAATAQLICQAYRELARRSHCADVAVAVRSSATAEDLPEASFAGQQETFLNVRGEAALLEACRRCYASLYTDRAIAYREAKQFDHLKVALSIGVQVMVRSDKAGSGVLFSIDTESGFPGVAVVSAAWGLGENVVQGSVDPDKYVVFKPLLGNADCAPIVEKTLGGKARKMIYAEAGGRTVNVDTTAAERESFVLNDEEILQLGRWAAIVEAHYGRPMDMEWAKDGQTGALYMLQARPETVQSARQSSVMKSYRLKRKGNRILTGAAVGEAIATGPVCVVRNVRDIERFRPGSILVTEVTDPDWVPVMKQAAGLITDHGGTTSHAAIVSREMGLPALVGTQCGTEVLQDGQIVTLSCADGEQGVVYEGALEFDTAEVDLTGIPATRTAMMVNMASPAGAFRWWRLPARGVGLARMEFIINNIIRIHPMALAHFDTLKDERARGQIETLTRGYADKSEYFVDVLSRGIAKIAAAAYPHPAIVRLSDFKSNEYAHLLGGSQFEPAEENPMLGLRGASRYYSARYRDGFALECRAMRRVREQIGFRNVIVMVPFCRTPQEADQVLAVMAEHGLVRGREDLQVYVMCEIPSNIILAEEFARRFDGFSIGSNDLTQLILGVDRDSAELAQLFDERDEAVKSMIRDVIARAHACGVKVGICGQAPSNHPEFAAFLVGSGIDSISLNPDSFVDTTRRVAQAELELANAAVRGTPDGLCRAIRNTGSTIQRRSET